MNGEDLSRLKDFYSNLGVSGLRAYVDSFVGNDEIELGIIEKHLRGENILDLGCGYGRITSALVKRGYKAVGIDICREFISAAKRSNPELSFIGANIENMPIGDSTFDTAISMFGVFNDITAKETQLKCLREIRRVLRKEGNLIIELPYLEKTKHIQEMVKRYAEKHGGKYDGGGGFIDFSDRGKPIDTYIYSKGEMTGLMLETGFNQIEYDEFESNWWPRLVVIGYS